MESWIKSKVGCGYVYGATGWVCSPKRRQQQADQYPKQADFIMNVCVKWDGKECYDCAQLIRRALEYAGVTGVPSGATSQWNKKSLWSETGTIDTLPSDGTLVLFREGSGAMQHVGWRLSDGTVVDARSSERGVVTSKVSDYKWTHWARPVIGSIDRKEYVTDMEALYKAVVTTQSDPLRVRTFAKTGEIIGRIAKGKTVEVLSEAEDGWQRIRFGELEGYASSEYLAAVKSVAAMIIVDDAGNTFIPEGNWRVMVNG